MTDELFDEARILYELFTKSQQPVDKDTIGRLGSIIGLSHGPEELLARLHRLMSGLPAEDELIAIAVWMERCKLIHKLGQEQFPLSSRDDYQVPDLYAVFDYDGEEIPVLIEVKTTNKPPFMKKLRFSERSYTKLTNYAKLNNLPLLIAWKRFGHWVLFDIREMRKQETAYHIDLESAMKADLMFSLIGNINISPMPGVGFSLIFKDLGPTGRKSTNSEEHRGKVHGIRVSDVNGRQIDKMNTAELLLFLFAAKEEKQHRHDDLIEITYSIIEKPSWIPSYGLLAFMLFGMRSEENRPSNWYEIIKNDDFGSMSYSQFHEAMEASIGIFVQYIMQIVPNNIPDFLSGNAAANPA